MKKLILGLMMAFAANVAMAKIDPDVEIEGLKYDIDTVKRTATLTGYKESPTKISVDSIVYGTHNHNVTAVGDSAFSECESLTEISLPSVTSVDEWAFYWCPNLTKVSLPLVTSVGERAFETCESLTEISLPSATSIGGGAFYCTPLTEISLPLATSVGEHAFDACESLTEISLPLATSVGRRAFDGCVSLTEISLPLATSVGEYAFDGCVSLTKVSLPSATSIGMNAFLDCSSLQELIVKDVAMKQVLESNRGKYFIGDNVKIDYVPELTAAQTKQAEWKVVLISGDQVISQSVYDHACDCYGITPKPEPQVVGADEVAVKKESIAAPSAGTVTVEGNKVQLGVTVLKTSDLTAEKKDWGKVKLTKDNIDVDDDGNIIVNVPVDSASGFMVIQTKDAKITPAE